MHLSTKRVNYDNTTIKYDSVKLSEKELLVMLFTNYILSSNFQKIKIVFILNSVYQYCCARSKNGYFYSHPFKITLFAVKTRWL